MEEKEGAGNDGGKTWSRGKAQGMMEGMHGEGRRRE